MFPYFFIFFYVTIDLQEGAKMIEIQVTFYPVQRVCIALCPFTHV